MTRAPLRSQYPLSFHPCGILQPYRQRHLLCTLGVVCGTCRVATRKTLSACVVYIAQLRLELIMPRALADVLFGASRLVAWDPVSLTIVSLVVTGRDHLEASRRDATTCIVSCRVASSCSHRSTQVR